MSESIAQAFDMVLGITAFIVFTTLIMNYRASFADSVAGMSRYRESQNQVVYEHAREGTGTGITRKELISRMMSPLDYNVRIDGFLITQEAYHYLNYDYSMLPDHIFDVKYIYDTDGRLYEIWYVSR